MRPLAILLAASLPILAQAPPPSGPPAPHFATALGLTPDQQTRMKAIRDKYRESGQAGHEAARTQAQVFRAAMEDPKASEGQLRQAFDQMNAQRFQGLLQRRAMRQELRAVLTPDQQAKADAMRAEFRDRMKARMEARRAAWKNRQPQTP